MSRAFTLFGALALLSGVACTGATETTDTTDTTDTDATTYTLTIDAVTDGEIVLSPDGGVYDEGTEVTVSAVADEGFAFESWTGDLGGTTTPAVLVMDGDKAVGATFAAIPPKTFTVTLSAVENGVVTLDPEGGEYVAGTEVTVTATPSQGYALAEWTGDLTGRENPTTLMVDADKTVGASFEEGVVIQYATATNGSFTVDPPIADGEAVPWGTELTITATPDAGYEIDALFKMMYIFEPGWAYYLDEEFTSPHTITTDPNDARFLFFGELTKYVVGAYFVADDTWPVLDETLNVQYAQPGSKPLQYDVYAPSGATDLPIVVIIHGGGWSSNNEDIMRGQARYLAATGRYVVVSIDYRLTSDLDTPAPTLVNLIEDCFGAVAHIQEHAEDYGGDPTRIAVTGDSAGGHLSAVVGTMSNRIGDGGYDGEVGSEFVPTYVPDGTTLEQLEASLTSAIKAVAPSYGVFVTGDWDDAIAPLSNIPEAGDRVLPPQHCQAGEVDSTVTPASVQAYVTALEDAGQTVEYHEVAGAGHAYFDWKPDATTQTTFHDIGEPALDEMIAFFDGVFYPE